MGLVALRQTLQHTLRGRRGAVDDLIGVRRRDEAGLEGGRCQVDALLQHAPEVSLEQIDVRALNVGVIVHRRRGEEHADHGAAVGGD